MHAYGTEEFYIQLQNKRLFVQQKHEVSMQLYLTPVQDLLEKKLSVPAFLTCSETGIKLNQGVTEAKSTLLSHATASIGISQHYCQPQCKAFSGYLNYKVV